MFASLLATLLFSISVVCGHRSARLIGGLEANFWRLSTAALLLGGWSYIFGIGLQGASFPMFLLSGIVGIGIGDVAFFQALPRLGSRLTLLLVECLSAPLGAAIEWVWMDTRLTLNQVIWCAVALAGVGVALGPEQRRRFNRGELLSGIVLTLVAALGTAGGAVLSRKAYEIARTGALDVSGPNAAFQRVVGGLLIAGLALLVVKQHAFRVQARAPQSLVVEAAKKKWRGVWPWVLLNGLAGQTLGVSCMQWALQTTPTGIVLAIIAVTPILVIPLTLVFEGEKPSARSLIGGAVAVGGVVGLAFAR